MNSNLKSNRLVHICVAVITVCIISGSCHSSEGRSRCLRLNEIGLFSVPDTVFAHSDLECLDLGNDHFTMYPPLSALVDSSVNNLTRLPDSFHLLPKLKTLVLRGNRLEQLPLSIGSLANLESLDLSFNSNLHIAEELTTIARLKKLKVLNIVGVNTFRMNIDSITSVLGDKVEVIFKDGG